MSGKGFRLPIFFLPCIIGMLYYRRNFKSYISRTLGSTSRTMANNANIPTLVNTPDDNIGLDGFKHLLWRKPGGPGQW
jgi:hypothetical protein